MIPLTRVKQYTALLMLILGFIGTSQAAEKIYKWVDEKTGAISYSNTPPQDKDKATTTVPIVSAPHNNDTSATPGVSNTQVSTPTTSAVSEKDKQEHEELLKKNCTVATTNLETLSKNKLIVVEEPGGKARTLTPEEMNIQIEKAKKDITLFCKPDEAEQKKP